MDLSREITAFDPNIPIERASTPPASWYTEPAFHALEQRTVFRRTWQAAARLDALAETGQYVAGRTAGLSYVVSRGDDGVLRAFANSCRHKATEVCTGEGSLPHFTCPYHGWTYRLDGSLRTAPRIAGIEDLDRDQMALPALGLDTFGPFAMIHPSPSAPPLSRELKDLGDRLQWTSLRWHSRRVYEVECNWKAYVDNYLDGGYHIAHMHPGLAEQLDLDSYRTEIYATHSIQTCEPSARERERRIAGGALYVWVYPNLMLNRYGPCLDTNLVLPVAADRCRVLFDFWFDPERVTPEWASSSADDSERTQREDMDISTRVQRGMEMGLFSRGRYAPRVEVGIHHFHRLLAADLSP